jgi:hypothetical protein
MCPSVSAPASPNAAGVGRAADADAVEDDQERAAHRSSP